MLAFSTISHVGFLLLALSVNSEESITSFLFYLIQYSVTNLDAFFVVLAFGYIIQSATYSFGTANKLSNLSQSGGLGTSSATVFGSDITYISQLKGQFYENPILGLSLALCLFSMAGIPPLVGFFAKYMVLYSAIENGYYFLALVGIVASVISAAYYLRIIRVIHFDPDSLPMRSVSENRSLKDTTNNGNASFTCSDSKGIGIRGNGVLTRTHSYIIAVLTLLVVFFILSPSLVLNSSNLLALSLFTA